MARPHDRPHLRFEGAALIGQLRPDGAAIPRPPFTGDEATLGEFLQAAARQAGVEACDLGELTPRHRAMGGQERDDAPLRDVQPAGLAQQPDALAVQGRVEADQPEGQERFEIRRLPKSRQRSRAARRSAATSR